MPCRFEVTWSPVDGESEERGSLKLVGERNEIERRSSMKVKDRVHDRGAQILAKFLMDALVFFFVPVRTVRIYLEKHTNTRVIPQNFRGRQRARRFDSTRRGKRKKEEICTTAA